MSAPHGPKRLFRRQHLQEPVIEIYRTIERLHANAFIFPVRADIVAIDGLAGNIVGGNARGIRVNVVSPGVISTPGSTEFAKTTPGFSTEMWIQNIPLGRVGEAEEIAEVVALLASDRGKFITGANYRVDGGMTAR